MDKPPPMAEEVHKSKIGEKILPDDKNMKLQREPKNSPTRLLVVAVYFKLRRRFLSEGMQTEGIGRFNVNGKALSKILTGRHYMGGKYRKSCNRKEKPACTYSSQVTGGDGELTQEEKKRGGDQQQQQ